MAEGNERPRVWRPLLRFARVLVALLAGGGGTLWLVAREAMGGRVEGARRARAERSPQWRDGRFDNRLPRVDGPLPRALGAFAFGRSDHRKPATPIPVVARVGADFRTPPTSGLRVTWLGHSTLLLEIDGARVLIDPVWGERAFPFTFMGPKRFFVPPPRHYSGRGLGDANHTLWAGWAFAGPTHRAFYSGDTGLHDEFAEIGRRLGPFDVTMIETGAYDALWADIHLGPEQAVLAHRLVRGDVMLPVHWGLFDLALHGWTEPMERVLAAAAREDVRVATPRPGEMVEPVAIDAPTPWWLPVPWRSAAEAPVRSTGVEHLRRLVPTTRR
jgi:L-ascorbate metabolism protein UlaG (beta-lactamase superfamily)